MLTRGTKAQLTEVIVGFYRVLDDYDFGDDEDKVFCVNVGLSTTAPGGVRMRVYPSKGTLDDWAPAADCKGLYAHGDHCGGCPSAVERPEDTRGADDETLDG